MDKRVSSYIRPLYSIQWSDSKGDAFPSDLNLVWIDTPDSETRLHRGLEETCLKIRNRKGAPWLYIRLPAAAAGLGEKVIVEFTLFCNFEGRVWIEYDSVDETVLKIPGQPGAFKRTEASFVNKTGRFETIAIEISDAKFSNRINGADLRIVARRPAGEPIYISSVLVKQGGRDTTGATEQLSWPLVFERNSSPQCSIIIPVHNKIEYTVQCLQYLQLNTPPLYEIIVVDDRSDPGDLKTLKEIRGITIVENQECLGFAAACSAGAAVAKTEYLLFLNNDTIPLEGWLEPMLETISSDSVIGVVGSKLIYPGSFQIQHAGVAFERHGFPYHLGLNEPVDDVAVDKDCFVDAVTGACLLTRRSIYTELGGFDEAYRNGYEDIDYCLRVAELGYTTRYCSRSELWHYESVTEGRINYLQEVGNRNLFLARWLTPGDSVLEAESSGTIDRCQDYQQGSQAPKVIAFYLPQFHRVSENDEWWGDGFTEWDNTRQASKLYDDHYQPREPNDLGYYDLTDPGVRRRQAELASQYGIHGFCYYYYWFNGRKLLEQPIEAMLESGEPDFPFCICWANENWTRLWDGAEDEILIEQKHCENSDIAFIEQVLPILTDPRYIRVDGKPLLLVYQTALFDDIQATSERWRGVCREAGLGEILLASCNSIADKDLPPGFDLTVDFPPRDSRTNPVNHQIAALADGFSGVVFDYSDFSKMHLEADSATHPRFRAAMLAWDNSARRGMDAHLSHGFTPQNYQYWLASLLAEAEENARPFEPLVFVNAWNEWGEGSHLEPDKRYGRQNLEATRNALEHFQASSGSGALTGSRLDRAIGKAKGRGV